MADPITASPKTASAPAPATRWWENEDWLAVIAAVPILIAVAAGWKPGMPSFSWTSMGDVGKIFSGENLALSAVLLALFLGISFLALAASLGKKTLSFIGGAVVVFLLAWLSQGLAGQATAKTWGIEYVIFALGLGLLWSHLLPMPGGLREAARAEFFIKVGIVIHGATIALPEIMKAGLPGIIQAALVIPVVWYACYFLAKKFKVDDEFAVMLSTAVSICGVSAAIAACGAIQGDKRKLSYVTSLVLICAVPMIVIMPWAVKALSLSPEVGGAWMGGTLDTTASVTAATKVIGEKAIDVGSIVKMAQNVLIGVAAFWLSIWWTLKKGGSTGEKPSVKVIWERFPKFVIGFVLASLVFSYLLPTDVVKAAKDPIKGLRDVWFAAAFVCIGLETRLGDLFKLGGGRPALAFLGGQAVNILWTLLLAWLLFRNA